MMGLTRNLGAIEKWPIGESEEKELSQQWFGGVSVDSVIREMTGRGYNLLLDEIDGTWFAEWHTKKGFGVTFSNPVRAIRQAALRAIQYEEYTQKGVIEDLKVLNKAVEILRSRGGSVIADNVNQHAAAIKRSI